MEHRSAHRHAHRAMKPEDILALMVPGTYLLMLAIEARFPARQFPKVRWWRVIGMFCLVGALAVGTIVPLLLPGEWLERHRLIDATRLGVPLGVVAGFAVVSFVSFAWHRSLHRFDILWRLCHQIHHSPRRVDLSSAVVFHPFDIILFTVVQTLGLTLVIGLDPLAAAITGYVATFYAFFQHWNVRTPRWLGYVIQRPEAHCHHHERDVHASNYSDFPLWDILFGSFKSPAAFEGQVGFAKPALGKMLLFVDVNATATAHEHTVDAAAE
jgi:sterol desaturase/sphingolipid hydroxylase (fatty acid hydroxylase superfamily)